MPVGGREEMWIFCKFLHVRIIRGEGSILRIFHLSNFPEAKKVPYTNKWRLRPPYASRRQWRAGGGGREGLEGKEIEDGFDNDATN